VLFDFSAAFPSLDHEYMITVLRGRGIPAKWIRYVEALYKQNTCYLNVAGGIHPGFDISAGIRQGCPLSPILFAVVLDLFVRRLLRRAPQATVRAYADDLAMIFDDVAKELGGIQCEFQDLEHAAGLGLNLRKSIHIPLYTDNVLAAHRDFVRAAPAWRAITSQLCGTYLGFVVGPNRGERSWTKGLAKTLSRARAWSRLGLGAAYTAELYRIYIASTLLYVGQLEDLPQNWPEHERQLIQILFPGPYRWLPAEIAKEMHSWGMPKGLAYMDTQVLAAKLRVATWENAKHGGLQLARRERQLEDMIRASEAVTMRAKWDDWFSRSFVVVLQRAVRRAGQDGVSDHRVQTSIMLKHPELPEAECRRRRRVEYQRTARHLLEAARQQARDLRLAWVWRRRLSRWNIAMYPRVRVAVLQTNLALLKQAVPPRVIAATIRSALNGWCTSRRFQQQRPCLLACGSGNDALEHYCACRRTWEVAWSCLALPRPATYEACVAGMLGLSDRSTPLNKKISMAVLNYGVYAVVNTARCQAIAEDDVPGALRQAIRNAARGHNALSRHIDSSWAQERRAADGDQPPAPPTRRPRRS